MIIIGIYSYHDGAISIVKDRTLVSCIEAEKIDGNARHSNLDPNLQAKLHFNEPVIYVHGGYWSYRKDPNIAPYSDIDGGHLCKRYKRRSHQSFTHVTCHILGTYCTSPQSIRKEPVLSLAWDGGQPATLYYIDPKSELPISMLARITPITASIYGIMAYYYGPYKTNKVYENRPIQPDDPMKGNYEWPGKIMAYIAYGKVHSGLLQDLETLHDNIWLQYIQTFTYKTFLKHYSAEHAFMNGVVNLNKKYKLSDATILATIHNHLTEYVIKKILRIAPNGLPIHFSGGAALNIKFNSSLANLVTDNVMQDVWVPPFPNDSGIAIGAACSYNALKRNIWKLNWNVYSGPDIIEDALGRRIAMTSYELGVQLAKYNEPIVVLNGKAELGPRALGHRSIMMSPLLEENKVSLNKIKKREEFRPIAPMCLEIDADQNFKIIKNDPYMLYDHHIRTNGKGIIPAIQHIDGTARVQIVSQNACKDTYDILSGFKSVTGVGVLCNTSANDSGKGFFHSVSSAIQWSRKNGVKFVWCNGKLYSA